ncbi:MAG: hypothetical protein ACR2RA_03705, partial [Geminicoccaceae bacterium]
MYAFLFNSQHSYFADEPFYGPACVSVVVQELEKLDPIPKTQIVRGDMTPWQLSYRISEIELGDNSGAPKSNYAQSSLSVKTDRISQEPDYELFKTVICDLAETL